MTTVLTLDGIDDDIVRAIGPLTDYNFGTKAALVKRLSTGSTHNVLVLTTQGHSTKSSSALYISFDQFGLSEIWNGSSKHPPTVDANVWWLVVVRKPTGVANPRWSIKNLSTGAWTHGTGSASIGDTSVDPGATGDIRFSANNASYGHLRVAALAVWKNTLPWTADAAGDTAIQNANLDVAFQNWINAEPTTAWRFNQPNISTPVIDNAANWANETSRTGTAVVDDVDLTFDYDLAPHLKGVGTRSGLSPRTSLSLAAPPNIKAGDIIKLKMFLDQGAVTINPPTGFLHAKNSPVQIPSGPGAHGQAVMWKRADGTETGPFVITWDGSSRYCEGQSALWNNVVATGDPWDTAAVGDAPTATDTASGTTTPPVNITAAGTHRAIIHVGTNWFGGTWTPGTNFVKRSTGNEDLYFGDKQQLAAGNTGAVTASCTGSDKRTAWIGSLIGLAVAGGAAVEGAAALSGEGTLTASGRSIARGAISLSASGTLAASGLARARGTATVSADSNLTAVGLARARGALAASGDGSLSASARVAVTVSVALSGDGTLSAVPTSTTQQGAANLSASGVLAVSARSIARGAAGFTADSAADVVGIARSRGASTLSADGSLNAVGIARSRAALLLSGDGALTASAIARVRAALALSAEGLLSALPAGATQTGAAVLSASGTLSVAGITRVRGAATLAAEGTLLVAGLARAQGATALSGTTVMFVIGRSKSIAAVVFSANGTMLVTGQSGAVKIYLFNGTSWVQIPQRYTYDGTSWASSPAPIHL